MANTTVGKSGKNLSKEALSRIEAQKKQLALIQLPRIEFHDTPLRHAIAYLQQRSMSLDTEKEEDLKGLNIILKADSIEQSNVTLTLKNVSLGDALHFTCTAAGLEYTVEENAIVISKKG